MSRAFVERGVEATLLDRHEVIDYVGDAYGLNELEGLTLVGGDFLTDPLPEGPFDIVLISNILHMYSPERNVELLRKVGEVTAPGGVAAVFDFVRGRSGRAARFALVMLLHTEGGDTYTEAEYAGWLGETGFRDVMTGDIDPDRQLVTAIRGS